MHTGVVINCLIVDDHPLACAAIENLLKDVKYIRRVESMSCTVQALETIKSGAIDLLILDVNLGSSDGFDFLRRVKAHGYKGKVLFISASDSAVHINAALKIGADGYVCKSENLNLIRESIDNIVNGYSIFKFKPSEHHSLGTVELSKREVVVYNYLVQGKSNKDISELLSLSSKTVSTYKRRILNKYNVSSIVELVNSKNIE
ncbi:response regulator [Vibrio sp. TBV020]|uniref:response regulator n=1 Tax=Vibrio sp. TBV020 TaxID=3137398 RepID=UPI0038CD99F7